MVVVLNGASVKDKHDPRDFEQFVTLNDDGTVAAVAMRAVGSPGPDESSVFLNVTHLGAIPLDHVKVDPNLVVAIKEKRTALAAAALQHAQAFTDHATALRITLDAFSAEAAKGPAAPNG